MTRAEHVQWCKDRAKVEIEFSKDPHQGIISIVSDLRKHPETANHAAITLGVMMMAGGHLDTIPQAIEWIDGVN